MIYSAVCAIALCTAISCGGTQSKSPSQAEQKDTTEMKEAVVEDSPASASYDIERIKSIKHPTETDNDFLLDQYELVSKETKGMDKNAQKTYLMKKGEEGKVLAFLIMGVENSKSLTEAQQKRRTEIQEKYK